MKLYTYLASDNNLIFGEMNLFDNVEPFVPNINVTVVGQKPDYSEYLVLTDDVHELLTPYSGDYSDWDFVYKQEWGLTINDDVIERVVKELRTKALNNIVVTVGDKTFDGNEKAITNMLSAIQTSAITNITSTLWKLADNSIVTVTLDELKTALSLAAKKTGEILFTIVFEKH